MSRAAGLVSVVALVAVVSSASPTVAQLEGVTLSITSAIAELELDPGETETITLTLSNEGVFDGTATVSVDPGESGWTAALSDTDVPVPAGGTSTVELALTASEARTPAADAAIVEVMGTIADATGAFTSSASTSIAGGLSAPQPPPAPFPWLAVISGIVAVVVALALGASWAAVHRRENGIELAVPPTPTRARPGQDAFVPLTVRNVSRRHRIARVHAEGVPGGWTAGTNLSSIPLDPGQSVDLWLAVRPPLESVHGSEVELRLVARPAEARRVPNGARLRILVSDRESRPDMPAADLVRLRSPDETT